MENKDRKGDQSLATILRKSEKLTMAVYMLTDFFDDRESLKWELREKSVSFLSFVSSLFYRDKKGTTKDDSQALIGGLLTLLELARNSFLISPMNFLIIKEEYRLLLGTLKRERENGELLYDFEFPERFFASTQSRHDKGNGIKDKNSVFGESIKDTVGNNTLSSHDNAPYGENPPSYRKDIRRDTIMKIIRTKGEITIKDISSLVRGVSEKTLQRELLAMVAEGILSKEGERRWSRYLIKHETRIT